MQSKVQSHPCNACGSLLLADGLDFGTQPIANQLLDSPKVSSLTTRLAVTICRECALIQLVESTDPSIFYTNYATPSSWKAEPHAERLITELEERLPKNSRILEVGANDGKFLLNLAASGWTDLIGLEPTANTAESCRSLGFEVIESALTSSFGAELVKKHGQWDCVITRQVLEHISDLQDFVNALRMLVKPGGLLIVEVPDARINLSMRDYSVWEEHVNYFTPFTLETVIVNAGFDVELLYESVFSGGCLSLIARRRESSMLAGQAKPNNQAVQHANRVFDHWVADFQGFQSNIRKFFARYASDGGCILWGVGARSTNFINIMGVGAHISAVVDEQPGKQGKIMPGTLKEIMPPSSLARKQFAMSTLVLGVNAENEELVMKKTSLQPKQWVSILPPSAHLITGWLE